MGLVVLAALHLIVQMTVPTALADQEDLLALVVQEGLVDQEGRWEEGGEGVV